MKELSKENLIDCAIETTAWNVCNVYELPKSAELELVKQELKMLIQAIRKLIEKRPKVTRAFIEKWAYKINDVWAGKIKEKDFIIKLLAEAGIEVKDD